MFDTKKMSLSSGKALGTFTLAALMSVLLIKLFSELALADEPILPREMPPLDSPAVKMGTYRIESIHQTSPNYTGSICEPYQNPHGVQESPDPRCGKLVWAARTKDQVALIKMNDSEKNDDLLTATILDSGFKKKCESSIKMEEAKNGLFQSEFCRAFLMTEKQPEDKIQIRKGFDVFYLNDSMDPKSISAELQSKEDALTHLSILIPIGMASEKKIYLPNSKEEQAPLQIEVKERSFASFGLPIPFLGVTAVITHKIILTRVSN